MSSWHHGKRLALLSAAVLLGAAPLPLQAQGFTPAQQSIFMQRRLNVETRGRVSIAVGRYGGGGEAWTQWEASEGFTRLSEGDFFRRVGLPQQAQQADAYHRNGKTLTWAGLGASALGLVVMFAGMPSQGPVIGGAVLALGGLVPFAIGVRTLNHNRFPYSNVSGLAESYNEQLRQRILRGEVK